MKVMLSTPARGALRAFEAWLAKQAPAAGNRLFSGCVALHHEDGTVLVWRYASAVQFTHDQDEWIGVATEHHGLHIYAASECTVSATDAWPPGSPRRVRLRPHERRKGEGVTRPAQQGGKR